MNNFLRLKSKNKDHIESMLESERKNKGKNQLPIDLLHIKYDLTPQKYLSMIVCEIGNIPPHSIPVVIREILSNENDEINDDLFGE